MADALLTAIACGISLAAALHWAHRDDRRRERTIDEIIGRRYTQPTQLRIWHDDTFSTATSVRTRSASCYGAEAAVDPHEQTAHAADRLQASVAHAGTEPTPSRRFGAPGGVGLLAPTRDTTPHPLPGRRRI